MGLRVSCAVFFCALLDFAGLAALLPVLFFLLDGGEGKEAAFLFCLFALAFILLKNGLAAGLSRFRNHFLLSLYRRFSLSLFTSYYRRGLLFIRGRGSTRLGYEVNYVCYAFSFNLLSPLLRMAGDALLVLLVTAALLLYAPLPVLMLYAAFVPFLSVYGVAVKKRMRRYGEEEMHARREQSRLVTEALKGYVELELNAAFPFLRRSFADGLNKISQCRLKLETVQHLPLCLAELAVISGLTLLTAFGTGEEDVKALAGVFAVAAFRLLPALRNILSGWTQVQNALCYLHIVEEGLTPGADDGFYLSFAGESPSRSEAAGAEPDKLPFREAIRIKGISYRYPDGKEVLKNFYCTVFKGEYVGICGESGIGKSTLFNLLLGFIRPDEGRIMVDDWELTERTRTAWHRRVGYVQQEVFIMDATLARNIAPGCAQIDREKVTMILRQVRLDDWAEGLPQGMDTPLGESGNKLSGGQKQRVAIARALYKDADVLFLDEATSALDNETERAVNETLLALKEECRGLTILMIAHRESSLAYCRRIITLNNAGSV